MNLKENKWEISLMASYVGAILLYSIDHAGVLGYIAIFTAIIIVTMFYALFIIWNKYQSTERTKLLVIVILFSIFVHISTILIKAYFGGIISIAVGFAIVYFFFINLD